MATICPRLGCLKKKRGGFDGGWRWEGYLKKPDVIRSPRNKTQKKKGSPSAVGVFGTPHRQVQGTPERNFLEVTRDVMQLGQLGWSSGSKEFPGNCLMPLNL